MTTLTQAHMPRDQYLQGIEVGGTGPGWHGEAGHGKTPEAAVADLIEREAAIWADTCNIAVIA